MKRFEVLAAFVLLAATACAGPNPPSPQDNAPLTIRRLVIPPWSDLHVGMKVYLSHDELGKKTQLVCASARDYNVADRKQKARCNDRRYGTPAYVTRIIPSTLRDWYYPEPLVEITALDHSWRGVTGVGSLQPDVPLGTVVTVTRKQYPVGLAPEQDSLNWGPDIGTNADVKVLEYDPLTPDARPLYVRVLHGRYAGSEGWLFMRDLELQESMYSAYGIVYGPLPELSGGFKSFGTGGL